MKSLKKIVSWIMTLTLICAAIPLLNQSVAEAEEAPGKTYFVSLTGNDNDPGTIEKPFATLEKARDTIRGLSADEKKDGVTVYLREGDYTMNSGFELKKTDSGTAEAPIVYAAYENETVTLTGQVTLDNNKFTVVTEENADPGIWDRIRTKARGKVVMYDLGAEGIPTGEILTSSPALYVGGIAQRLAEYPNQPATGTAKYIKPTSIIDNGWDPIDDKDQGDGGGQRPPVLGYEGHKNEARIDKWANEDEVFLRGNFAYEWLLSTLQVKVDATAKTLTGLTNLTATKSMCKFYAYNLLCEMDIEGEFYIDRSMVNGKRADKLYLHVGDEGLGDKVVALSILTDSLLTMKNVSYVSFQGINFCNTLNTGVKITNCESCEIRDAEVKGCTKDGIAVKGGHNVVVSGCSIHDLSGTGVVLDGGNFTTLDNSKHVVEYSDIYKVLGNGVTVQGVGQIVRRNHIYDLPLTAIGWSGNDHLMEFNDIENVCYDTSDAGAIYGGRSWTFRGNVMRYNFFHGMEWLNGHVIYAIYLDDALSSVEIYGNVISDWWMQGICLGGGRDIKIHDNIYIDTPGWKIAAGDRTFSDWFNVDLVSEPYKDKPITNEYWAAKYPKLAATAGHLVEIWSEQHNKMYPDKSLRDVDEPDILNPLYPTGNKVFNEISVGTVNDWATLTNNDMPLISELGDFQMPQMLYDTPEAQEAYMQALSNGIRTATMEQMDAWKADYVSTLSDTAPTE